MYQLINVFSPQTIIAQSDDIADLWPEVDNQHFMTKNSLLITKGDEIVAGATSLLDRMVEYQTSSLKQLIFMAQI